MKDKKTIDYDKKLSEKKQHVEAVSSFLYWVIDELRKRAAEHDKDKIEALSKHQLVDGHDHHQLRHHILSADNNVKDPNIIDIVEFMADNVASALYESDDGRTLADPMSSPKIKDLSLDKLIRNTAKTYRNIKWRMINDPDIWK